MSMPDNNHARFLNFFVFILIVCFDCPASCQHRSKCQGFFPCWRKSQLLNYICFKKDWKSTIIFSCGLSTSKAFPQIWHYDVICEIKYMSCPHGQLLSFHDQTLKAAPVSSRWRPRYFLDPYEIQIKLMAPSSDRLQWKDAGFVPSSAGKWSQVFHVSFFGRLPWSISGQSKQSITY